MLLLQSFAFGDEQIVPADFFCQSTMLDPPVAFQNTATACSQSGDSNAPQFSVCQQKVMCAIVPAQKRQWIANMYKIEKQQDLPFDHLPSDYVLGKLANSGAEYFPTYVTCQAKTPGPNAVCPGPNECKGDYRYNPQAAAVDSSAASAGVNSMGPATAPAAIGAGSTL